KMMKLLGEALFNVGPDRLLYGSEGFLYPRVQTFIDSFASLEMPVDLQEGYGYPALDRESKEKIFGRNLARILGIDVEAKLKELAREPVAWARRRCRAGRRAHRDRRRRESRPAGPPRRDRRHRRRRPGTRPRAVHRRLHDVRVPEDDARRRRLPAPGLDRRR